MAGEQRAWRHHRMHGARSVDREADLAAPAAAARSVFSRGNDISETPQRCCGRNTLSSFASAISPQSPPRRVFAHHLAWGNVEGCRWHTLLRARVTVRFRHACSPPACPVSVTRRRRIPTSRMLTLFHHPFCPHSRFVRLALGEYGLEVRLIEERTWDRRHDFLAMNPAGTTPVLVEEGHPPFPAPGSSPNISTRPTAQSWRSGASYRPRAARASRCAD